MVGVLLFILKIIGIILLIVLALIILIGAVVLFVPIRYIADASYIDKKAGLSAKVTWLLNAVRFRAELKKKGLVMSLKVLGFTLFTNDEEEKRRKRKRKKRRSIKKEQAEKKSGQKKETNGQEIVHSSESEPSDKEGGQVIGSELISKKDGQSIGSEQTSQKDGQSVGSEQTGQKDGQDEASGSHDKRDEDGEAAVFSESGQDMEAIVIENEQANKRDNDPADDKSWSDDSAATQYEEDSGGGGLIGNIIGKIKAVISFIRDPENDELIALILKTLKTLLLQVRPRELEIEAIVGLEDPADTAKVLAIAYMLYPLYDGCIRVEGDFIDQRIDGRIHAAGRMYLIVFAVAGLKLYLNKDFMKLLHRIL